jgi:arsenate reductase (thioredoxin)
MTVLFACTHNAGRSQMAAAWFNVLADASSAHAESAGTQPAEHVHPAVVEAMREVGIDLSSTRPRRLIPSLASSADWLITMGCGEACPVVPGVKRDDWAIDDPAHLPLPAVRRIRDEIRRRVQEFVNREGVSRPAG